MYATTLAFTDACPSVNYISSFKRIKEHCSRAPSTRVALTAVEQILAPIKAIGILSSNLVRLGLHCNVSLYTYNIMYLPPTES